MKDIGKLLKEAQKMQKQFEALQSSLAERELEVTQGGGAVRVKIDGKGTIQSLKIDPDFLKEDVSMVEETLLSAIQEAQSQVKDLSESEMGKITGGMGGLPGFGGF